MGRDQRPVRAAVWFGSPYGWGGLSLTTYLEPRPADVPLSMGVIEPQVLPSQLNAVEFHWDSTKRTSLFLQVSLKVGLGRGQRSDKGGSTLDGKEM